MDIEYQNLVDHHLPSADVVPVKVSTSKRKLRIVQLLH